MRDEKGFTLIELIIVIAIIGIIAGIAVAQLQTAPQRARESVLKEDLYAIRDVIDQYFADKGKYPESLDTLVDGVEKTGALGQKIKFLRRIPIDPMTKTKDWGLRSYQDDADSNSWGHENVYDVYTNSQGKALDGKTFYKDW